MSVAKSSLLPKGEVINNTYVIECFIGSGAFGDVYRVNHKFLGVQVLKVLKKEFVDNTNLTTLSNEALILSKLTHKNIVRVFDSNTFRINDKSFHFISMEFVSGESLHQLTRRKICLSLAATLSIQIEILQALNEVHSQTPMLIHRDISPDNVLLCYDNEKPRVLLTDFGLAQSVDQLSGISNAAGKYLYFAPECFWGVYLPASDVFASGIVIYRMLTGTFPWDYDFDKINGSDAQSTRRSIVRARKQTIKPPSYYNENCSQNLDHIIQKSLAIELEDRYLNSKDFLHDLQDELQQCLRKNLFTENEMFSYY